MRRLVVLALVLTCVACEKVSYAGFSVLEVVPGSEEQLKAISGMMEVVPCRKLTEQLGVGRPLHLLCDRKQSKQIRSMSKSAGFKLVVTSRSFQKEIEKEIAPRYVGRNNRPRKRKRMKSLHRRKDSGIERKKKNHKNYISFDEMVDFLEGLDQKYDNFVLDSIGTTSENRDIKLVKLNSENTSLPIIFIDAGIHAREWIAPASTLYVIEKLAKLINRNDIEHKTKQYQWHILPLANPDGYEYSRTTDRLWRKNTRPLTGFVGAVTKLIPGNSCFGVDLNRNFPEGYGVGASNNPCNEIYMGPQPFSEPESQAIRDYVDKIRGNTKVAISVHAYGNVLIYPWGYKHVVHPDSDKLARLAGLVRDAILKKTGEVYTAGTAVEVFGSWGLAGGATDDYYISRGIPYSFTFELPERDENGGHEFLLPPENIVRVGKQLMVGLNTIAKQTDL